MARKWILPPRRGIISGGRVIKEDSGKKHYSGPRIVRQDQAAAAPATGNRFKMMI